MTSGSTSESAQKLRLLYDLGCAFAARLELEELVPTVIRECRELFGADGVALLLVDRETNQLCFPYVAEEDPAVGARLLQLRFPADRGLAGEALRTDRGLRIDDVQSDPRFYEGIDKQTGLTTRTMIAAPLRWRDDPIGVIQVVNKRGGEAFTEDDLLFLESLAGGIAIALDNARLYQRARSAEAELREEVGSLRRDLAGRAPEEELVGSAPALAEVRGLIETAAPSPLAVLLTGETGSGKELVARAIHRASPRATGPFLAVNCAALSESLLESELFGHRRGAFTGALQDRRGFFEAASGGTIFLDEVGDTPLAMQAKLLRVLQNGEVVPVGDVRPRRVDVRVIAATHRDLEAEISANRFRADLYYRLAGFPIRIPPLRERREDIPLLAERFAERSAARQGKTIHGIDATAMTRLRSFDWPGNVRELRNEMERAVALAADGGVIEPIHLSEKLVPESARVAPSEEGSLQGGEEGEITPLSIAREGFETAHVKRVLELHRGNVSRAARALGISRVMLHRKIKKHGLRS